MNKFILFEGMDRTGKTTISKNLALEFNGVYLHSPPLQIIDSRKPFDDSTDDVLCFDFYHIGNHMLNAQVSLALPKSPVFLDRHFPSTIAAHEPFLGRCLDYLMGEMNPIPVRIYYLTASPKEVLRRCMATGTKNDRFHRPEIIPLIHANYERLFTGSKSVLRIDTTHITEEEVYRIVKEDLNTL